MKSNCRHAIVQALEPRTLLCGPEVLSQIASQQTSGGTTENFAGLIVWDNEGSIGNDSDFFRQVFGNDADAELAREVVRGVIRAFENTITNFNYSQSPSPPPDNQFHVHLEMGSPGFGAGSFITQMWGDKPKGAGIVIGGGNTTPQRGYFLDDSPDDYSEFTGTFVNPFAAEAISGAAHDRPDFYSTVAHEIAHALGLGTTARWNARGTNTNIADNIRGVGNFWTFSGPSIQHLMTSFNGGVNSGAPVHTADAGANINFNSINWRGATDLGNAGLAVGARFLIPDTLSLMYRDAYGYTTTNANVRPTFHAVHDPDARTLLIRGGVVGTNSDDVITIGRSGSMISVSVDIGSDVPGMGALPGAGNIAAYTSFFESSQVSTITIRGLDGDDTININGVFSGTTINVLGNFGNDTIHLTPTGNNLDLISGTLSIDGGTDVPATDSDHLFIHDTSNGFNDTFDITSTTFRRTIVPQMTLSGLETMRIDAGGGNNTFNVTSQISGTSMGINGGGGNDVMNVGASGGGNVDAVDGTVNFNGEGGSDTFNYNDAANAAASHTYTLTSLAATRTNSGLAIFANTEAINFNAGSGANTINLNSTAAGSGTTLNANGGADTIDVGASAAAVLTVNGGDADDILNLDNIPGLSDFVFFNGNGGINDTLNYNANNSVNNDVYEINSNNIERVGVVDIFHNTFEQVVINAGTGNDDFFVETTASGITYTINANNGADSLDITQSSGNLGNADGLIIFNGGGGTSDTATLWDNLNTANDSYTITSTQVTRAGFGGLSSATTEGLALNCSSGGNTINVNSTSSICPVTVNAGNGTDTINVNETAPGAPVRIAPSAGSDTVNVNSGGIGTAIAIFNSTQRIGALSISTGGSAELTVGASKVLTASSVLISGNGFLNLNDNDMIVDYSAVSSLNAISTYVASGYHGGAWDWPGIRSASAAAAGNTGIGIAEATDLFSTFPATFSGQSIDNTAILLKYTFYGDSNLDGNVNLSDFNRLAANFGQTARRWVHGDGDYNGAINLADFNRVAGNFGATGLAPEVWESSEDTEAELSPPTDVIT